MQNGRVITGNVGYPQVKINKHGHVFITLTGMSLTGREEVRSLKLLGCDVSPVAFACFSSQEAGGYDALHRLDQDKKYTIVLMAGTMFPIVLRSTENLVRCGLRGYGYHEPKAGLAPHLARIISPDYLRVLGAQFIVVSHQPIIGRMLTINMALNQACVETSLVDSKWCWAKEAVFAFSADNENL